jgi:acetyl-CoA C-acetyltransferase
VAIVGGIRIPFCRAYTGYAHASNQDMMTAVLRALVQRYGLEGQKLDDVALGAVLKHSRDFNFCARVDVVVRPRARDAGVRRSARAARASRPRS